jgi:hypothetical protein
MTYRQASELGAQVRRGEQGALSLYYSSFKKTETDAVSGEAVERSIRFLRHYIVFNADQIDGLPGYITRPRCRPRRCPSLRQAAIDSFFAAIPADVRHGGNGAFTRPPSTISRCPSARASSRWTIMRALGSTRYVTSQVSSFRGQSMAFARCCCATIVWPAVRFQDGSPDHAQQRTHRYIHARHQ